MAWIDRVRAWLRGGDVAAGGGRRSERGGPTRGGGGGGARRGGRGDDPGDPALVDFARTRTGVEAYLEPRTAVHPRSVLLVAADGEILRRPVADDERVRRFCARQGIPVYDAARVGYPRRIRDFDRGVRQDPVRLSDLPPWPGSDTDGDAGGAAGGPLPGTADGTASDDGPPAPPPDA